MITRAWSCSSRRGWFHIPKGVLISDVKPDTPAERASLKSGDVVTHVNGIAVVSPPAFYEAVAGAVGPIELTMYNFPPVDPPTKIQVK